MKICIFGFWQDLGFGECFFSIQIQIKKRIEKLIFQLLARSWFWWMLFCIQILLTMTIENLLSFSFWQDLGFGECFFYSNSNWKKYWKLTFSAFGKILVLANAFSIQILIEKKYWKLTFSAFGKILVLANAFFYSNSNEKYFEKLIFLSFWQDLGLGDCFFSTEILIKTVLKNWFFQLLARSWFWRMLFWIEILI